MCRSAKNKKRNGTQAVPQRVEKVLYGGEAAQGSLV